MVELVAAGSVSDYDAGIKAGIAAALAALAGVDASRVSVAVLPASVRIVATVHAIDRWGGESLYLKTHSMTACTHLNASPFSSQVPHG